MRRYQVVEKASAGTGSTAGGTVTGGRRVWLWAARAVGREQQNDRLPCLVRAGVASALFSTPGWSPDAGRRRLAASRHALGDVDAQKAADRPARSACGRSFGTQRTGHPDARWVFIQYPGVGCGTVRALSDSPAHLGTSASQPSSGFLGWVRAGLVQQKRQPCGDYLDIDWRTGCSPISSSAT